MNEQDWADRFTQDVDALLGDAGRGDDEPTPADYRQTLGLARVLATADFSDESEGRAALRRRLLNRVGVQPARRRGLLGRHTVPVTLLVVAALFLVAGAWRGVLAQLLQSLQLGPHTSVQQAVPAGDPGTPCPSGGLALQVVQREGGWIVRTAIGSFGGNVRPGERAEVLRLDSVEQVQAATGSDLREPAYLPTGYELREALIAPGDTGFFLYDGPQGEIVLVQTPVYVEEEQAGGVTTSNSVVVGILSDAPVEEVVRGEWRAGWFEGNSLVWEAEGVSYTLGGANLSLDEAIRIAESVG